jgi:hypothetical protein
VYVRTYWKCVEDKLANNHMAVWQFDLQLIPDQIVLDAPQCIESAITDDGLDAANWWLANQPNGSEADNKVEDTVPKGAKA